MPVISPWVSQQRQGARPRSPGPGTLATPPASGTPAAPGPAAKPGPTAPTRQPSLKQLRPLRNLGAQQAAPRGRPGDSLAEAHVPTSGHRDRVQLRSPWPGLEASKKDVDAATEEFAVEAMLCTVAPDARCPAVLLDYQQVGPGRFLEAVLRSTDALFTFEECEREWDYADDSQFGAWEEMRQKWSKFSARGSGSARGLRT